MLSPPETLKAATAQSVQVSETETHGQEKPASASRTVCDLAEADAFCESYGKPHVPVSVAFGGEPLHVCRLQGSWDLDRMVSENFYALFRSVPRGPSKDAPVEWEYLTF